VYVAASSATHPVMFQSVTLTGGIATFAPKPNGFGATTSPGADLYLGNITESAPDSGITMAGLRTLFLDGDNTYTGPTTVNSGTLVFSPNPSTGHSTSSIAAVTGTAPVIINAGASVTSDGVQLPSLTISGALAIRTNGTASGTSKINALTITGVTNAWTGGLDLMDNSLIVEDSTTHSTTLATLKNQVTFGLTHDLGIFSSTLPASEALAVIDNAAAGFTSFGGLPVDSGSILVAPEVLGDANADGIVSATDFNILAGHFNATGQNWLTGDFNGDGIVNALDFDLLAAHYGQSLPPPPGPGPALGTLVPEPAALMLLPIGFGALKHRHRAHRP
jgi:autotransporter-associated beta strand protein